jgi:uncharacterized protein YkwD
MLLALIGGSLYLSRGASSAASPSSHGAVTALQTSDACGSAPGEGACVQRGPAGISTATAPPDSTTQPAARPRASASPSSSQAASKPATSASAPVSPGASPSTSANPPATPATPGASAGQVLALINAARSAAGGMPALTITSGLETTAAAHNLLMASGCGLSHQCPGEPAIGARETAAGIHWTAAGENIGEGGPVADTTAAITQMAVTLTQDMLNEQPPNDGHRMNILSTSFTHIGIAVYRDSSGTVWLTQDFSN